MLNIVVLSGAGISAESGISTFRDADGLWENYSVEEICSTTGWKRNRNAMIGFYNARRKELESKEPNEAHKYFAYLESVREVNGEKGELALKYNVSIITQNVDDLHERAGSSSVLHLHGELTKGSNESKTDVFDIGYREILSNEKCADGTGVRPFIVWFGEAVPMLEEAVKIVETADILVVIGTSLQVYPAASLHRYAKKGCRKFIIDPNCPKMEGEDKAFIVIKEKATLGVKTLDKKIEEQNS